MVLSNAYNYINVLDKAADASWTRNDVLANNIANEDTPGYSMDGNNVDITTENVELAKNQLKYYTLMNSINQEFTRLKSALKTS